MHSLSRKSRRKTKKTATHASISGTARTRGRRPT